MRSWRSSGSVGGLAGNRWVYPAGTTSLTGRGLSSTVRGAADKAAHLMGCKSSYRQLPDSDGEHIRGVGR